MLSTHFQILILCLCIKTSVLASTKYFTLILERQLLSGFSKLQVTVNGTIPGPSLRVTFGDKVVVNVINNIFDDASTVHWHGMNMKGTPWSDGIVNITQCPISNIPGNNTLQYTFTPDRAGTFFYHGHYHEQQQDGLYGALIVMDNNVTQTQFSEAGVSYDVDEDEWTWIVSDWFAVPASLLATQLLAINSGGADPIPDAFIVNNKFTGRYNLKGVRRNETTRVRVIHAGSHSSFWVSVDGMPLTVIELDGVAVEPLELPNIRISVAQRVSFLLNWTALSPTLTASDAVWFRFTADKSVFPQATSEAPYYGLFGTASGLPLNLEWKGRISFNDSVVTPSYRNATPPVLDIAGVTDLNFLQARPIVHAVAPNATYFVEMLVTFNTVDGLSRAYLNGETAVMSMTDEPQPAPLPMLYQYLTDNGGPLMSPVIETRNNLSYITGSAIAPFVLPFNETIEVLISACCGDHPFHLHGHHFWIVAASDNAAAESLYADNYLMRDIVIVPSNGWVRIRFVSDNPGVWWLHCHLHWHLDMGLLATVIEAPQQLSDGEFYNTLTIPESDRQMCSAPLALNFSATPTPTAVPSLQPSNISSTATPTMRSREPTISPSAIPSLMPSEAPSNDSLPVLSEAPSFRPTAMPSFRPTISPVTQRPSVGLVSDITLTFQSIFTIDGLLPVLSDRAAQDVGFVDWCVTDSAAQSFDIDSAYVTIVNTTASSDALSFRGAHSAQRQLVPQLQDATTTVERTVLVKVTSGQFPQYVTMTALYESLVHSLQVSAISGNYSDALKEHLLLGYTPEEVKDVQLVALAVTPAVVHYPIVTASPSVSPSSSSSGGGSGGFYYGGDDQQGDDVSDMSAQTMTLVIATTSAGAIVLLIVVYEMWRRGEREKRKSKHSITSLVDQTYDESGGEYHFNNNNRTNTTIRPPTVNTTGATDPATQSTVDVEQAGAAFDPTLDESSPHRSTSTSSPDQGSNRLYYVVERERHVSFQSDREGSSPESKRGDGDSSRHHSRQLNVVDSDKKSRADTETSSAYSYRPEEPWRLRWVG